MREVTMKKPTNWMPAVRHKCSQNAGVLVALGDDALAAVDAPIKVSSRKSRRDNVPRALPATLLHDGIADTLVSIGADPVTRASDRRGLPNVRRCLV